MGKDRRRSCSQRSDNTDPRVEPLNDADDAELSIVEHLSHPHIVYSFGVSHSTDKRSIFMEEMDSDLNQLIVEKVRDNGNAPPFSHHDSVDILLQLAKAMAYTHGKDVVHGGLKPENIYVSKILIS